jgi:hypothetical protein
MKLSSMKARSYKIRGFREIPGQLQLSSGRSISKPENLATRQSRTANTAPLSALRKSCKSSKLLVFGKTACGSSDRPDKPVHEHLSGETKPRTDTDTPLKGVLLSEMSALVTALHDRETAAVTATVTAKLSSVTL